LFLRYLLVNLESSAALSRVRAIEGATRFLKMNSEVVALEDSLVATLRNFCVPGKLLTDDVLASICSQIGMAAGELADHGYSAARASVGRAGLPDGA
jgi:hypothetical protein